MLCRMRKLYTDRWSSQIKIGDKLVCHQVQLCAVTEIDIYIFSELHDLLRKSWLKYFTCLCGHLSCATHCRVDTLLLPQRLR